MADKPQPVRVLYCPVCSLPAAYCEFGPDFEKCKPWLIHNAPDLYPDLLKEANAKEAGEVSDQLQSTSISSAGVVRAASSAPKQEEVKRLPGGKIKKKEKQEVVIEKVTRNKRKCITTVKGLDLFGVKLSDASKKLGKKFATGASVVKGPTEKEQIDVQGDIAYDIVDFITETWPDVRYSPESGPWDWRSAIGYVAAIPGYKKKVSETAIFFIEDGRKVLLDNEIMAKKYYGLLCIIFFPTCASPFKIPQHMEEKKQHYGHDAVEETLEIPFDYDTSRGQNQK